MDEGSHVAHMVKAPLSLQYADRLSDRVGAHIELGGEIAEGRQFHPGDQLTVGHLPAQRLRHRTVTRSPGTREDVAVDLALSGLHTYRIITL